MRIEGFLVQRRLLHRIRNRSVKLYVPVCVLFERDFEDLVSARRQGLLVHPLLTVDELDLVIPRRLRSLRLLLENEVREICIVSQSVQQLEQRVDTLELLLDVFSIVVILMSDQVDVERCTLFMNSTLMLYLPLSRTSIDLLKRCDKCGIVLSTRLFTRRGRACERIPPALIYRYVEMLKQAKPSCRVIVDILGIDSRTASL